MRGNLGKMNKKNKVNYEKLEREYVVNLRKKVNIVARYRRTEKAIKTLKEFIAKHMKIEDRDLRKVRLDKYLNEYLWSRGIKNPPMKVKVKAIRDKDIVRVEMAELPSDLKFKKARHERTEKKVKTKKKGEVVEEKKEEQTPETKVKEEASKVAEQQIEKEMARERKHEDKIPKENQKGHSKGKQGH